MELGSWYAILGVALIIIAFLERFIVYKVLLGQGRLLPEQAGQIANLASLGTILAGTLLILVNYFGSRH